jgi:hypothetical protein
MTEITDMPATPLGGALTAARPTKRKLIACAVAPLGIMALLCVIDVQTMGQQKPAACESAQESVSVPKPHIWLAGAITGLRDEHRPLRDIMAASHPDVALTQVIAANPTLGMTPMGDVPATYGGAACLNLPTPAATATPESTPPKVISQGKAPGQP